MIQREDRGEVTVLQLAHGKANALDVVLLTALSRMLGELESSATRAIVLSGRGRIFSAGVDLFKILEGGPSYLQVFLPALRDAIEKLFFFPKPVVAAINGHAIAGGCILACACDGRLMARGPFKIGAPELLVGVPFPTLGLEVLRYVVPARYLEEVIYGGRVYLPEEAQERGLLHEIVEENNLLERSLERARRLAALPPSAFQITKDQLRKPVRNRLQEEARIDAEVAKVWAAPDTQEKIREYLARTLRK